MKNGEVPEISFNRGPLIYDVVKLLADILTQNEGTFIRDPKILDYLFKDVVELIKDGTPFTFSDIA